MHDSLRRWFLLLSLSAYAAAGLAQSHASYRFRVDGSLSVMAAQACFYGSAPAALHATSDSAGRYLSEVRINGGRHGGYDRRNGVINLAGFSSGDCLEYKVDLQSVASDTWMPKGGRTMRDNIVVSPSAWMWLPGTDLDGVEVDIIFEHPDDFTVSAPWELISRKKSETVYRMGNAPLEWEALVAIGRITVDSVEVPGAVLRLAILDGQPHVRYRELRNWIEHGALAVTNLYGRFPIPSPQILVVPIGKHDEAVPWGQVLRGGGPAAHLFIDQTHSADEFMQDWVLVHELSHMIHPYIGRGGAWLAEGLASYYQNVLQARIGAFTPEEAWRKLYEGFERGIRQTHKGGDLNRISREMRENHQYMRVYWSGAAIFLLADLELRRQGKSLDYAVSEFQKCCLSSGRQWSAYKVMEKLDNLTGSGIFTDLYGRYVRSDEFPDVHSAYKQLGISIVRGDLEFDNRMPYAGLRKSIMSP